MSLISHLIAVKTGRGEIADERIMKKQHFAETGKPAMKNNYDLDFFLYLCQGQEKVLDMNCKQVPSAVLIKINFNRFYTLYTM